MRSFKEYVEIKEDMDYQEPPAIVINAEHFYPSNKFVDLLKTVENAQMVGFEDGKWYPHPSPEGGAPTIAYGHKIQRGEDFYNGITDAEALQLLRNDIQEAWNRADNDLRQMYGVSMKSLPNWKQEVLVDYAFNLGTIKGFPKFTMALLRDDVPGMQAEYKRVYRDAKGVKRELRGRNDAIYRNYLMKL